MNRLTVSPLLVAISATSLHFAVVAQPAQTSTAQCVLAGRIDLAQRWAPQARGVELLDASGQRVSGASKDLLASVKAVRLSQPALLSNCHGNQALPDGETSSGNKSPVPAVSAAHAPIPVQAVTYPPLRVGGSLVELQVEIPADRVIALHR
jgi:hypothetical protein